MIAQLAILKPTLFFQSIMMEHEQERQPFERVPEELRASSQWVLWRPEAEQKIPVNPYTLGNAGVTWPNTWASFDTAREAALRQDFGLGYVLTKHDLLTCIDLDNCVDDHGTVSVYTREMLDLLSGWVELSPSEKGLHIWIQNDEPVNRRTKGIEIYSTDRWMTVTGRSNPNQPLIVPERTRELDEFIQWYFPEPTGTLTELSYYPDNDEEVWDRLFNAKNGSFFRALYNGDTSVTHNDHSRGVIMLANQLALMTGGDSERIRQLLYQTGLACDKWEEQRGSQTWIDYQIADAIAYVSQKSVGSGRVDRAVKDDPYIFR